MFVRSHAVPHRVSAAANVLFHQFGGEAVLLNITNETYYRLDEVALSMWQALMETESVDEAKARLLDEYDTTAEMLDADLAGFIAYLAQAKLIEVEG
jgi:hypothetical protein